MVSALSYVDLSRQLALILSCRFIESDGGDWVFPLETHFSQKRSFGYFYYLYSILS